MQLENRWNGSRKRQRKTITSTKENITTHSKYGLENKQQHQLVAAICSVACVRFSFYMATTASIPKLLLFTSTTAVVVNFVFCGGDPRKLSPDIFQPGTASTREKFACTNRGGNPR